MITESERIDLKAILPKEFAKTVADSLNHKNIRTKRGKLYDSSLIRKILRGEQEDINAELEIFRYRDNYERKLHELNSLKQKITQSATAEKSE